MKPKTKRAWKIVVIVVAILVGAWALATLLELVGDVKESKADRSNLNTEVDNLTASNKELSKALKEANRRCAKGEGCTPVQEPSEDDSEEVQDIEIQEPEIDDPDPDDPEKQDKEIQDPEIQDPEIPDDEVQDGEINDPDPDDPEKQDPEIQDEETQDPEIDDPDPASPYDFSFSFMVPGPGGSPGQTYIVTCNSGTGNCTVSQ